MFLRTGEPVAKGNILSASFSQIMFKGYDYSKSLSWLVLNKGCNKPHLDQALKFDNLRKISSIKVITQDDSISNGDEPFLRKLSWCQVN